MQGRIVAFLYATTPHVALTVNAVADYRAPAVPYRHRLGTPYPGGAYRFT